MKVKILLCFILYFTLISCNEKNVVKKIGKYEDNSKNLQINVQQIDKNKLLANHCFVNYDGSRIDCCEETSMFLNIEKDNLYIGHLKNCYDQTSHPISIVFCNDSSFFLIMEDHPFLIDTIKFFYYGCNAPNLAIE